MNSELKELYAQQMSDSYSSASQSVGLFKKMKEVATDEELKGLIEGGIKGTQIGMDTYEKLAKDVGSEVGDVFCIATKGLVDEAQRDAIDREFDNNENRDISICLQIMRFAHYGITLNQGNKAITSAAGMDEHSKNQSFNIEKAQENIEIAKKIIKRLSA